MENSDSITIPTLTDSFSAFSSLFPSFFPPAPWGKQGAGQGGWGSMERKETSQMAGEPCRATSLVVVDCWARNERDHVKLSQV